MERYFMFSVTVMNGNQLGGSSLYWRTYDGKFPARSAIIAQAAKDHGAEPSSVAFTSIFEFKSKDDFDSFVELN